MTRKEALQQRKELLNLIDQWTAAEIMARLGQISTVEWADFFKLVLKKKDEMRQLIYGESDLVKLGKLFGILKSKPG